MQHISFVEGRGNIICEYPGEPGGGIVSFVGCHMDVVPANPDTVSSILGARSSERGTLLAPIPVFAGPTFLL